MLWGYDEETEIMTIPYTSTNRPQDENQPETSRPICRVRDFPDNTLYDACDGP